MYTHIKDLARWREDIGGRRRCTSKCVDMEKSMGCGGTASGSNRGIQELKISALVVVDRLK